MWVCPGRFVCDGLEVGDAVQSFSQSSQRSAQMQNQHLNSKFLLSSKALSTVLNPLITGALTTSQGRLFLRLGTAGTPGALLEDTHLIAQECLSVLKVCTESGIQNRCCFLLFETQTLLHCSLTQEPERIRGQIRMFALFSFSERELCQNCEQVARF